jgi:hypothetical protein
MLNFHLHDGFRLEITIHLNAVFHICSLQCVSQGACFWVARVGSLKIFLSLINTERVFIHKMNN